MQVLRNNNFSFWSVFLPTLFCLFVVVFAASSSAQNNPLPVPQAAPLQDAKTAPKGSDQMGASTRDKGAISGKKLDFGGAIADLLAANPECAELTNNCQICIRRNADNAACSLPGIACAQGTWTCTKSQAAPKPAQ